MEVEREDGVGLEVGRPRSSACGAAEGRLYGSREVVKEARSLGFEVEEKLMNIMLHAGWIRESLVDSRRRLRAAARCMEGKLVGVREAMVDGESSRL